MKKIMVNQRNKEENQLDSVTLKKLKRETKGITLIALVVTIVLNCCEAAMDRINRKSKIIEII